MLWPKGPNGGVIDLGNLGGTILNLAFYINNRGQIVGQSALPGSANCTPNSPPQDCPFHAFLWQSGIIRDLGTLPGDFSSYAGSINNNSQVVGQSCDANFNCRAFFWENGVMTDLNTLTLAGSPLFLVIAFGINSSREISGLGITSAGEAHAFLATPDNGSAGGAKPKLALPENLRQFIQQRLHRGPKVQTRAQ